MSSHSTFLKILAAVTLLAAPQVSSADAPIGAYLNGAFPTSDPTGGGTQPPALLSQTGAFSNLSSLTAIAGLRPYTVNSPLWSDAAIKSRWIAVPGDGNRNTPGEKVVFSPDSAWAFPAGTVAVKHFELGISETNPALRRRLETRFLIKTPTDFYGITYRWRPDGSDADLLPDSASDDISIAQIGGSTRTQRWDYPGRADCRTCHNVGGGTYLGLVTHQLNGNILYPGESTPQNQLEAWVSANFFTTTIGPASSYAASSAVGDTSAPLAQRVHSYLAANCSNCHYPGNLSASFDLRYATPLENQNIISGNVLYDLGIPGAKVVSPAEPNRSILYLRMNTTGIHKMPPIGRNVIDQTAVDTIRDWILTLDNGGGPGGNNPPIANNDEGLTQQGTSTQIAAFSNDIDPDNDSFSRSQSTQPSYGSATWSGSGVVTYTPNSSFTGTDSFTYRLVDSVGALSNWATVTVIVSPASTANSISFSDRSNRLPDSSDASGVAMSVVDMDQDGLDDIVHFDLARQLYIDYQKPNGANFTRRSLGTQSSQVAWGMAVGDADNNGMPDIISGGYYDGLHYYRANSNGTSYNKTVLSSPTVFLQAVNFADINMDGWLDVFACHDDAESAKFRNLGNGNMVGNTGMMNTATSPSSDNSGNYGSVWTDYDNDGDLDLYVSKCRATASSWSDPRRINQLFRNNGSGQYTEVAASAGLASGAQSWTADFGDIDNDGDLDCFVGNHMSASKLMRNNGNGTFTDVTSARGMSVGWKVIQSIFRDFNNDGWLDLLLTGEQHEMWLNDRDGTFTKISNPFSSTTIESCAVGDLDHDGFPDVYAGYADFYNIPNTAKPDKMFLSNPNGNGFISIELRGRQSNKLASGAMLELHGPWGTQIREVRTGEGYGITNSFSQRFGLGNAASASQLVVKWPSGVVDSATNINANQFLLLEEGDTQAPSLTNPGNRSTNTNTSAQLQLTASDPTNNTLTYAASNLPTGLSINPNTGLISGTTGSSAATFPVSVSVSDGWSTVSRSFNWSIIGTDTTPPTVTLSTGSATVSGTFEVAATFSENISGLTTSDFTTTAGNISNLAGSGSAYTFNVNPTVTGQITIRLPASRVIDTAGNGNLVSNLLTVTYTTPDTTPPTVALSTASNAVTAPFAVTYGFSEAISGFSLSDIVVTNGTASGLLSSSFTVSPLAEGAVTVRIPQNSVTDTAGNPNTASNLLSITYTAPVASGEITPNTNTIALYHLNGNAQDAWTNNLHLSADGSVQYANNAARFDALGDKLSVTIPDSLVLTSGTPLVIDARIFPRNWLAYSNDNYPVISLYQEWNSYLAIEDQKWGTNPKGPNVQSSTGTVASAAQIAAAITKNLWNRVWIIFDGTNKVAFHVNGTKISEATLPLNIDRTNSWTLTLGNFDGDIDEVHISHALPSTGPDTTAPTPTLATASTFVTGPFTVNVSFDETVTGFTASDLTVSNATVSAFSQTQFTLTPIADGNITVSIPAAAATDAAGNPSITSNTLTVSYTIPAPGGGDEYTPNANTIALYHMNGTFNDASSNSLHLSTTGSVQLINNTARFDAVGDTLSVTIPDSLVLPAGGQPLTIEARIYPVAWLGWSVDNLPVISLYQEWNSHFILEDQKWGGNPRGPMIKSSNGNLLAAQAWANAAPLNEWHTVRIVFDGTNTVTASIDGTQLSSAALPPVTGRTNDWTLTLGNFNGDIDEVYITRSLIVDGPDVTAPNVVLSTPSTTVDAAFPVTVNFDENVIGMTQSDLIVTNGSVSAFTGSGADYTFTVTPVTNGSVTIRIPASAASDSAGNNSTASSTLTVTYDNTPPPAGDDEYVADANTVALYHFNTSFADSTTNGLNLAVSGAVTLASDNLSWMSAPGGKVARFNAVGDKLTATIPDSLVLPDSGTKPLTIEARIYPRAWLGYSVDNLPVISLSQEWDSSLELQDAKWGTSPKGPRIVSADIPIATAAQWAAAAPLNQWAHLQISFNGTNTVSAWINGQPAGSLTLAPNKFRDNNWTLTLGHFRGDIDEVVVHRSAPAGVGAATAAITAAQAVTHEITGNVNLSTDPDNDRWSTQLEVALGSDPLTEAVPQIHISKDIDGKNCITFPAPDHAQDTASGCETAAFDYIVEISTDLQNWQPAPVTRIDSQPMEGGFSAITLRANTPPASRHFLRIRVDAK
jgi:uncharacterized repeat protein (TIGR03806 family)